LEPSDPSRVFKGKKLSGSLRNARITGDNLEIVDFKTEENLLCLKGVCREETGHNSGKKSK
jgi:ribosomal protein L3